MKSSNFVVILAILNAMLRRFADSLPELEQATRGLAHEFPSIPTVSDNGVSKFTV
jgi:hypothetical protein